MVQQQAADIIRILAGHGCTQWVVAPGSRSAPLVLAVARLAGMQVHMVADERVAGYTALGMAVAMGKPVGVIVTSGTAALNLIPASAEALLSEVPLFFLTADRPPEAIGQQDGQAVYQSGAFAKNVKSAYDFPVGQSPADLRHAHRLANEAGLAATTAPFGPVHLNIPFAEPFYPAEGEAYDFARPIPIWKRVQAPALPDRPQLVELLHAWQAAQRRIVVVGTQEYDLDFHNALKALLYYAPDTLLCADPTANVADLAEINMPLVADFGSLPGVAEDALILHIGGAITSRKLRTWLRGLQGKVWRVQPNAAPAPDPFYKLEKVVVAEPAAFITKLGENSFFETSEATPKPGWEIDVPNQETLLRAQPAEALWAKWVLESAPEECIVHLANSMPVRWAQWFWKPGPHQKVWCNRGASGIDGCTSTAVGYARQADKPVLLLTGETAFFYDRNALWTGESLPKNLKIVILNNGGGGIFKLIDGPGNLPEKERFFVNPHTLSARSAAEDFGLAYHVCEKVSPALLQEKLWQIQGPAILEIICK